MKWFKRQRKRKPTLPDCISIQGPGILVIHDIKAFMKLEDVQRQLRAVKRLRDSGLIGLHK